MVTFSFSTICWNHNSFIFRHIYFWRNNLYCPLLTTNRICTIILCPMSTKMFYSVSRYVISELLSFVFAFFIKLPIPSEQTPSKERVTEASVAKNNKCVNHQQTIGIARSSYQLSRVIPTLYMLKGQLPFPGMIWSEFDGCANLSWVTWNKVRAYLNLFAACQPSLPSVPMDNFIKEASVLLPCHEIWIWR